MEGTEGKLAQGTVFSFKTINLSMDDMNKFEAKEMRNNRTLAEVTWYKRQINYVPESIKTVSDFKEKDMSLLKKHKQGL